MSFFYAYPSYATTTKLDELRAANIRCSPRTPIRLHRGESICHLADRPHLELLQQRLLAPPLDEPVSVRRDLEYVTRARRAVLRFFTRRPMNGSRLRRNASHALKLIGESYRSARRPVSADVRHHNSVNGIREFARAAGAEATYVAGGPPGNARRRSRPGARPRHGAARRNNLFAYPASPTSPVSSIRSSGSLRRSRKAGCAAGCGRRSRRRTASIWSRWKPDFVVQLVLQALLAIPPAWVVCSARQDRVAKLRPPWFSGGTITWRGAGRQVLPRGRTVGFREGTLIFSDAGIEIGLQHGESIGIDTIHERVRCLTGWLWISYSR